MVDLLNRRKGNIHKILKAYDRLGVGLYMSDLSSDFPSTGGGDFELIEQEVVDFDTYILRGVDRSQEDWVYLDAFVTEESRSSILIEAAFLYDERGAPLLDWSDIGVVATEEDFDSGTTDWLVAGFAGRDRIIGNG